MSLFFLGWVERFKNWNQRWNGTVPVSYHKFEGFEEKERIRKCYIRLWWRYILHYILNFCFIKMFKCINAYCSNVCFLFAFTGLFIYMHPLLLIWSPRGWGWRENSHVKMSVMHVEKRDHFGCASSFICPLKDTTLKRTESVFFNNFFEFKPTRYLDC